jgi:outer membrane protein
MVPAIQNLKQSINRFMEKKFRIILSVALVLLFAQGIFNLLWLKHGTKTAYINTETVYNDFGLKKKMEADLKKTQLIRTNILDSMKLQLDMMYAHMQEKQQLDDSLLINAFTNLRDQYFKRKEEFTQANETLAQQYTGQIWSQLNQYLQDYGHAKGYEYIFGANGDGNLMFADDAVNITEEVKGYVNERFKGQP